jgi:rhodanese-related sulfurtransferase
MKRINIVLTLVILTSLVLTACGSQPEPVVEEAAPEEAVEEEVAEEVAEESETEESDEGSGPGLCCLAEPATLDGVYTSMLGSMSGYNTVKTADVLLAEMAEDNPPFILDVRTLDEVTETGHIDGAAHIPLNELALHVDQLPSFDTPIVTYCKGGWRATIAMTALYGMGFENVRALKVGFPDWKEDGNPVVEGVPEAVVLNAADVDENLQFTADLYLEGIKDHGSKFGILSADDLNIGIAENPDLVVIDVRRQEEVDEKGFIEAPNWVHFPLESFIDTRADWPADLDTPIAIYCGSGHRSTMAMTILFNYGYTDVTSLSGGIAGWVTAGFPVAGGAGPLDANYQTMIDNMVGYNTIKTADDLLLEMAEDNPPFVLDVRTVEELEDGGYIEGAAAHIPLDVLAQNLDQLPSFDTPIVTYCKGGWRATIAMTALHAMGWTDVRALKVGFPTWAEDGFPVSEGLPEIVVLDAAQPDAGVVAKVDAALTTVKGLGTKWGIMTADTLNTALVENSDMILMDVRKTSEWEEQGVIAVVDQELVTLPIEEMIANQDLWPADKDAEIVIYCGSGHRSTMAMEMLLSYGYSNVTSLSGGFSGWVVAEYPVADYVAP